MKKFLTLLTVFVFTVSLAGCSFGTNKKIFEDDVNTAINNIKNPDSTDAKNAINLMYKGFTSVCTDLNDTQKASLKDKCKQLYISFFSNVKCDKVTVSISGSTANVDTSITINNIEAMKNDMQSEIQKLSSSIQKMSEDELKTFFGGVDVSTLSQSQVTYQILMKGLDNTLTSFKGKNYAKTSDLKLVYKKTGKSWNVTDDSKKKMEALFDPGD